jgi:hypothetical protein
MNGSGLRGGDVVGGRFELLQRAGAGGMGVVYRARDAHTGAIVALKLMREIEEGLVLRFQRESRILARISHPSVLRHIADGVTREGCPYLVTEWCEGEDLAVRLSRAPLRVSETVQMMLRVAQGLAAAHAKSIVHRDLKPSNLLLQDGNPLHPKVIDFGVARSADETGGTGTGEFVGSLGYMAPEIIFNGKDVDCRCDVVSLGCILFKCLTGQSPFARKSLADTIQLLATGHIPSTRQIRPDVPEALENAVSKMLAHEPEARFGDAGKVAEELERILWTLDDSSVVTFDRATRALSFDERCIVSAVVVVGARETPREKDRASPTPMAETWGQRIRAAADAHGAELTILAERTGIISTRARTTPLADALDAARCALDVRAADPGARVALVTFPVTKAGPWKMEPLIEHAVALLQRTLHHRVGNVRIDASTAELLRGRLPIQPLGDDVCLADAEADDGVEDAPPRDAGEPPMVGRERALALLHAVLAECREDSAPRFVQVHGEPGIGKSRLVDEFQRQVRERGDARVLRVSCRAAGDTPSTSSAARLVERASGLSRTAPASTRSDALRSQVLATMDAARGNVVADFLCELTGTPISGEPSAELLAARADPKRLRDAMESATASWVSEMCRSAPLVLVLEGVSMESDRSPYAIERVLARVSAGALLAIAVGGGDVWTPQLSTVIFGRLDAQPSQPNTSDTHLSIHVERLRPAAARRLARSHLGEDAPDEVVSSVVDRAAGNPLLIAELSSAARRPEGSPLTLTALAIAQSRIEALEPPLRLIARALSMYDAPVSTDGIAALVGTALTLDEIREHLEQLRKRGLVEMLPSREALDPCRWHIRNGLVRNAAYHSLTDADRTTGHALVAERLEQDASADPVAVAQHFVRAGRPNEARRHFLRAADPSHRS